MTFIHPGVRNPNDSMCIWHPNSITRPDSTKMHGGKPAKLNGKGKTTKPRPGKVPVSMTLGTTVERDLVARNKTSCSLIRIENDPKVASRRILKSSADHPWKEVIYNWLETIQTPKSVVLYYSSRQRRQETRNRSKDVARFLSWAASWFLLSRSNLISLCGMAWSATAPRANWMALW